MKTSLLARLGALPLAVGLSLAWSPGAPAHAHGEGDVATNTRAAQVEPQGEGKRMRFVANLQYDRTGEAQNGSDIEFVRLGGKEYALAGTLRGGLQIIDITRPASRARSRRTTAPSARATSRSGRPGAGCWPATPLTAPSARPVRRPSAGATSSSTPATPAPCWST